MIAGEKVVDDFGPSVTGDDGGFGIEGSFGNGRVETIAGSDEWFVGISDGVQAIFVGKIEVGDGSDGKKDDEEVSKEEGSKREKFSDFRLHREIVSLKLAREDGVCQMFLGLGLVIRSERW